MVWPLRVLFLIGVALFVLGATSTTMRFLGEDYTVIHAMHGILFFAAGGAIMLMAIGCKVMFLDLGRP